jgi:hypothetical protein
MLWIREKFRAAVGNIKIMRHFLFRGVLSCTRGSRQADERTEEDDSVIATVSKLLFNSRSEAYTMLN